MDVVLIKQQNLAFKKTTGSSGRRFLPVMHDWHNFCRYKLFSFFYF
jgi:hypothetical protein